MADCKPENKKHPKRKNTFCYRCKKEDCGDECILTFTIDGDGKMIEKVHCECKKMKWDPPDDPVNGCAKNEQKDKNEQKNQKFYIRCEKKDCDKFCALWIEYKEGNGGTLTDIVKEWGCDCIDWA